REDNADLRLTEKGRELGLVDDKRWALFSEKMESIETELQRLRGQWIHPNSPLVEALNPNLNTPITREATFEDLLRRPEMDYPKLMSIDGFGPGLEDQRAAEQVQIQVKYSGYIQRQQGEIDKAIRHETTLLPLDLDYQEVPGLSNEVIAKMNEHKPETIGQASRISGMTPAAIS
ncbi:tRNA uridine-5-carboxymethylaminomethyl(34) synthesis enzyme MnmG, partial [Shewanella frigidimarina]